MSSANNDNTKWYNVKRKNNKGKTNGNKDENDKKRGGDRRNSGGRGKRNGVGRGGDRRNNRNGGGRGGDRRNNGNGGGRGGNRRNNRRNKNKEQEEIKTEPEEPKWERKPSAVGSWAHIASQPPKKPEQKEKRDEVSEDAGSESEGSLF